MNSLKLLKKGSRKQWIFKLQKIKRNQYITSFGILIQVGDFTWTEEVRMVPFQRTVTKSPFP
jgi:hypothetical protein